MRRVVPMLAVVLAVLTGLVVAPLTGFAASDEEEQLSEARQKLKDIDEELTEAQQEAKQADERLEDADERLEEIEQIVNEVALDVERQQRAVRDAERRLAEVEQEADELNEEYEARIARLFKQGPDLSFESLLSSGEFDEAVARTMLLERVTDGDQVDLERLDAASVAVDAQRERLAAEEAELQAKLEEQELVQADAQELRESRALAAAEAEERIEQLEAEHDDLEAEEAELEELIEQQQAEERRRQEQQRREEERQAQQQRSSNPGSSSGSGGSSSGSGGSVSGSGYAWPMCAPVTSEYGPRWGRMHRGIDLGASSGTAIGAVRAGTVIFAGWQGGYGNLVLIQHGDGVVTAYAHQSGLAVSQGTQVSRGQTVGYVGSTGNSTGPHLHLETRVNGSAVNPRQFLSGGPC